MVVDLLGRPEGPVVLVRRFPDLPFAYNVGCNCAGSDGGSEPTESLGLAQTDLQTRPWGLSLTQSVNFRTPGWSLSASTES